MQAESERIKEEAEGVLPDPGGGRVGAGLGARPQYQSQEGVQQPRPVPLQVKGRAVGQRNDSSCSRKGRRSQPRRSEPCRETEAGARPGGRATPALKGAAGRSPQRSQHCPSGRRGSKQAAWGQPPPRG